VIDPVLSLRRRPTVYRGGFRVRRRLASQDEYLAGRRGSAAQTLQKSGDRPLFRVCDDEAW
jgi:hypothetical protein